MERMPLVLLLAALVNSLVAVGCGGEGEGAEDIESFDAVAANGEPSATSAGFPLNNGALTNARPEIGQIFVIGACTATLIAPRYVLTASHCTNVDGQDTVPAGATFQTGNGTVRSISRIKTIGLEDAPIGQFNPDVSLVRLSSAIPASVALPATLSSVPPLAGQSVTVFGYGCNNTPGRGGQKQFFSWTYGPGLSQICPGDSGGPAVFGSVNGNGAIWGVNSFHAGSGDVWGTVPRFKEQILQIMRQWEGTGDLEVGIDRPGMDINNFASTSASACRRSCIDNSSCRAYTFSSTASRCFLKSAIPDWSARACPQCTSGIRPVQEANIDRPGADLLNFDLNEGRAELCTYECASRSNCMGYTYTPPGYAGNPKAHCFLKSAATSAVTNTAGLVSGLRASFESGVDRPGFDISDFATATRTSCMNSCDTDPDCMAFVYGAGRCYLKSAVPPPVAKAAFDSGVRRTSQLFTDRVGSDIASFVVEPPFVELCQSECESTAACRAFTFVYAPGTVFDDNATCFLKSAIPAPVTQPTGAAYQRLFSGIRELAFF